MELKDFIGNHKVVHSLISWLTDYFDGNVDKRYCVLYGDSGNGKSILLKLLADYFDAELFVVTPDDIRSEQDLDNIIKSLNTKSLFVDRKIVGIDDLDEFPSHFIKKLILINSIYPIIYTSKTLSLDNDFKNNSFKIVKKAIDKDGSERIVKQELLVLNKPLSSEVLTHLKGISDLPEETLERIAKESQSFRSAILSLHNTAVNDLVNPEQTGKEFLDSIKGRRLKRSLNRNDVRYIFDSIRGYGRGELTVMSKFAEWDYKCKVQFEEIDEFLVNNMKEPIQEIELKYRYIDNNSKPKKVEKPKVEEKKKEVTIDGWI